MSKRAAKGFESLVAPPAKKQTTLPFGAVTHNATAKEAPVIESLVAPRAKQQTTLPFGAVTHDATAKEAPMIESLVAPRAKQQTTLTFGAVTHDATAKEAPVIESLVAPLAKKQTTLPFGAVTNNATAKAAPMIESGCRFLDEGYLKALKARHGSEDRYRDFFRMNSLEGISRTLRRHFSSGLLEVLRGRKEFDLEALCAIGNDPHYGGPGWYMNIIIDENDPDWFAAYVGQSKYIRKRIRQHTVNYLFDDTLHYFSWRQPGKKSVFVHLGRVPGNLENIDMILNIGEQLLSIIFQTLPEKTLPEYLPVGVQIQLPHRGLNVARPMQQGHKDAVQETRVLLASSNALTLSYAEGIKSRKTDMLDKARQQQVEEEQVRQMATKRGHSKKAHLFREADALLGDLTSVMRWCRICRTTQSLDPAPIYEVSTGRYIARKAPCDTCVETAPGRIARSKNGRKTTYHIPVNPAFPHIRQEDIS
ncbi:uncharacterized protein K460DRAFT_396974 [Cucurbitaria berberidis CBS 394.84]|uniref:Uncharacterized protein n=1 Tax=Cucurbitaria berberidis CBS 394.84 TaxID=1168544 RepID=A0A9P4GEI1_9PLEO|nr:uncharacterized protein K460DRAFT_396974 [Cucurbitaria berberidis CBS 394.84]KAF1843745.1 hypothetical protein K460DRAFT_396974 [Cucurbitaria berberidis CBS 394.84]